MTTDAIYLLLLITIANGAPILARKLFNNKFSWPLDAGILFFDNRPVLGAAKTWRGLLSSLVISALAADLLGYGLVNGVIISLSAMMGDMLSSFVKRRLSRPASSQALLIDQVPESLLPCLFMQVEFHLRTVDVVLIVVIFVILELLLSRWLYKMGIRNRPY